MVSRPQLNMRLDPRTAGLLAALQAKLNLRTADVVRLAVARLAEQEKLGGPTNEEAVQHTTT